MKEENKRIYYVDYKDGGDYGCAEEVEVYESEMNPSTHKSYSGEEIAVMKVQQDLLDDYNFMSRLIEVYEITPEVAIHDDERASQHKNKQYDVKRTNRFIRLEGYYN